MQVLPHGYSWGVGVGIDDCRLMIEKMNVEREKK